MQSPSGEGEDWDGEVEGEEEEDGDGDDPALLGGAGLLPPPLPGVEEVTSIGSLPPSMDLTC